MHNFRLKYAPKSMSEVVFPSLQAKQIVTEMIELERLNHLILYGPCGAGKTTVAELIPEAVLGYKKGTDCLRFDADFDSSVDNVRDLKKFVERMCIGEKNVKFVVIDELDGLSSAAQKALRGILDSADSMDTFFIMTTNFIDSIEAGVKSRCNCVKFDDFSLDLWLPRIKQICKDEGIKASNDETLLRLISDYGADARELMKALESVVRQAKLSVV